MIKNTLLVVLILSAGYLAAQNEFITTWQTDNPGTSTSTEITIPTFGVGYSYDVDWNNDGTFDEFGITGNVTHDFGSTGTYTIRIQGSFPRIHFNLTGDRKKLLSVDQWGTNAWTNFNKAFYGCSNMHVLAADAPVLTGCTNLFLTFSGCAVMNEDLSSWNVGNITNFYGTFGQSYAFNQPLASWDVSSATTMFAMFQGTDFNQDISGWDVSGVKDFSHMFREATDFNQDISGWNTSSATVFKAMFRLASNFDQDLGQWDVSGVTDATDMFRSVTLSTANYDALLIGWNAQTLQSGVTFSGGNSLYCSSWAERDNMINSDGWIITDNGSAGPTPDITSLTDVSSACDVNTLVFPTATDNCAPGVTVTNNAVFPITEGTTVVTWTYTDSHGGFSTQDQTIIVDDITAPVGDLASLADVLDICNVTSLVAPTGNDECAILVTVTNDAVFPITEGTTIVTWTYDDGHGNTSTQMQNVIVDDITAPVGDLASLADVLDVCDVTSLVAPNGNDECASMVTVTNDAVFPITEGTTIVTWTYNDGHGNTSTQMQNVIVDDIIAPVGDSVSLMDIIAECDASASAPTGTDECATVVMVTSNVIFPITVQGTTVVTWTFDDGHGNTSTQLQNVILTDVTAPTASNPNSVTVQCVNDIPSPDPSSVTDEADNCTGPLVVAWVSDLTDGLSCPETITRTYSVTDAVGLSINVEQTILVMDDIAPLADSIDLADENSLCGVTLSAPTATDNCSGAVTGVADVVFPVTAVGTTTVTWTYTDACGNTSTQTQDVVIGSIDVSTSIASDNITIVASNAGQTYQWIDCNTGQALVNETNQNFTPTYGSDFAVIITENGCSDTSACVNSTVGIGEVTINNFFLYPNPTSNGDFAISYEGELRKVELIDMLGRIASVEVDLKSKTVSGSILDNGTYIVRLYTESNTVLQKELVVIK
jgi:surface protein